MKRVFLLLLAVVLLATGCAGSRNAKDVSVEDARCPYEIRHQEGTLAVTLRGEDVTWHTTLVPEDVCELTQGEGNGRYSITGLAEGAAQVVFTALDEKEREAFVLTLVVQIAANKTVSLESYDHRERTDTAMEEGGLSYQWNVDVNGILTFSFLNTEDRWSVHGEGEEICTLFDKLATSGGCKFSAEAKSEGQTVVTLVGETTGRTVYVTVQVAADTLEIVSVQEQ